MHFSFGFAIISVVALFAANGDAQPLHLSGQYNFGCSSADLTLSLTLTGGNGAESVNSGSSTIPIHCGGDYDWDQYQANLDQSKSNFENMCNTILSNLGVPDPEGKRTCLALGFLFRTSYTILLISIPVFFHLHQAAAQLPMSGGMVLTS